MIDQELLFSMSKIARTRGLSQVLKRVKFKTNRRKYFCDTGNQFYKLSLKLRIQNSKRDLVLLKRTKISSVLEMRETHASVLYQFSRSLGGLGCHFLERQNTPHVLTVVLLLPSFEASVVMGAGDRILG